MKFQKTLLALSLLVSSLVPALADNDYAPSASPQQETPASLPPPGLEAASTGSSSVGGQGKGHRGKGHKGKGLGSNPQKKQQMMARLDTNGDGMIDDGERAAAQAKRAQRKASGATGGGASGGKGKHGSKNPADKAARKQKMMARFDTNGDGQLDSNEKAALEAFRQQRRQQRMQRQGGAGAPQ